MLAWRHNPWSLLRDHLGVQMVVIVFAVSLGVGVLTHQSDYQTEAARARNDLVRDARLLARTAALACPDAVISLDLDLLQSYVDNLTSDVRHVQFARIERSSDDKVLASTPSSDPPVADDDLLVVKAPIQVEHGGDELARFVIGIWLQPMRRALEARAAAMLRRSLAGSLLVACAMWLGLRLLITRRLSRLDAHAQRLAAGELHTAIPSLGTAELGRLARTLEEMRRNLRQSHSDLAEQNEKLLGLNRLKSEFLANMSHELRTPLTGVLGGLELLTSGSLSAAEQADWLQTMQRNGEQLHELLNTILDLSKVDSGNMLMQYHDCVPEQCVHDVLDRYRDLARSKGLGFEALVDKSLGEMVVSDENRLRQVLTHVLDNALRFTEKGGVAVRATIEGVGHRRLLEVSVTDTGIGMTKEFLATVFQPFVQADGSLTRRHGGSGLGLAISRRIARELGGDVQIDSHPGQGTRVVVRVLAPLAPGPTQPLAQPLAQPVAQPLAQPVELPVEQSAEQPVALAPAPAGERSETVAEQPGGRVLLVDDAADNHKLLTAMLKRAGVTIEVACDGQEAVDKFEQHAAAGAPFDLVLMDLQMPVMDGISAIAELRSRGHKVPIVAITAHAMVEDRERCMAAGSDGYETKPIQHARLLRVLDTYLTGRGTPASNTHL